MRAAVARENVRELILDAADDLLARYGYKKMTVDDIARQVGIGKATIYLHFNSKEEIVLARIDRVISRLKDELRLLAQKKGPVGKRLREMLIMRVLYRFDSVQKYTESMSDILAAIRPALLKQRERHFADEARIFAQLLVEEKRTGELRFKDPEATAQTLLLATNYLLPYSLTTQQLGNRQEVKQKASNIADLLLTGLLKKQ